MKLIQPDILEQMVYEASKKAFSNIIEAYANEDFYAFGLWTDDSLQFIYPVANTEKRLDLTVKDYNENVDLKYDFESTHNNMRWSYGDWGFYPIEEGEDYFSIINEELAKVFNLDISEDEFEDIIGPLWDSVVKGFDRLNQDKFFDDYFVRKNIILLIVGDLEEEVLDNCATTLNPIKIAEKYINWNH